MSSSVSHTFFIMFIKNMSFAEFRRHLQHAKDTEQKEFTYNGNKYMRGTWSNGVVVYKRKRSKPKRSKKSR